MNRISFRFGTRGVVDVGFQPGQTIATLLASPEVQDLVGGQRVIAKVDGQEIAATSPAEGGYLVDLETASNTKG